MVQVSYLGKRTEVSEEILDEIHQNSEILEISLITTCPQYKRCEDQVELWSNKLRNIRVLNQYG